MKKQGISLITLVITIVIIIILAGAVILNLTDNNPINSAKKATVMQDIDTFRTELTLKLTTGYTNGIFDTKSINAVTKEDILKYIPSMKDVKIGGTLYTDILVISEGILAVDGTKANECVTNGKLTQEQYDWIVEALGNNVFNAQTYSIKYYINDGTEEYTESSKIHNVKYSILSNSKDRVGYGFKNWNTEKDGTGTTYNAGDEYTLNEALTLYAQWEAGTYTITYYKNDGTDEAKTATKTQDIAYQIVDQNFTRTGYTFDGWNTKEDGTGTDYAVGSSYTENRALELYAKWKISVNNITYYKNDGTNEKIVDTKEVGNAYTIVNKNFTRSGYNFAGWNTSADEEGTDYSVNANYNTNADLELYAKWRLVNVTAANAKAEPKKYYGTYVNYTPTNGCTVGWRVFLADGTQIYLIADDYVPNSYLTSTRLTKLTSTTYGEQHPNYCVYSSTSRQDLVTRLTTSSYYTGFKDSGGKALSVTGAPRLEQFVVSYNATNPSKPLYTHYHLTNSEEYGGYTSNASGYSLSFAEDSGYARYQTLIDCTLKNLYFIRNRTKALGMWIADFTTYSDSCVMSATWVGNIDYDVNANNCSSALRPLVTLNSGVKLIDPDGDGIYDLQ